mgnify:CR=1 FL=1
MSCSVALYSEADAGAPYLAMASETYAIGPAPARESYLHQDLIIDILKKSGADGLHPGYGFLSERAAFAEALKASAFANTTKAQPFVIPPFPSIAEVADLLAGTRVKVGAQNMHWETQGAWTGEALARAGALLPVRPVKGQVTLVRQPSNSIRYTIYGSGGYLVPRADGSVVNCSLGAKPPVLVPIIIELSDNTPAVGVSVALRSKSAVPARF